MQLKHTSAKAGYVWFRQGISIFCRSPLIFISMFFAYLFAIRIISLPPVLGTALLMVVIPGLSVGFLAASRTVLEGQIAFPTLLISGFRSHGATVAKRLLILGLIYFVAICLVFAVSALADDGVLAQLVLFGNAPADDAAAAAATSGGSAAMLLSMIAYLPVAMMFWFAPVLVAWHDVPPHNALFFSWVTFWRNKAAFIVYGALWLGSTMAISLLLTSVLLLTGVSSTATLLVLMPVSGVITAVLYCSFYATYRGCYVVDGPDMPTTIRKAPSVGP